MSYQAACRALGLRRRRGFFLDPEGNPYLVVYVFPDEDWPLRMRWTGFCCWCGREVSHSGIPLAGGLIGHRAAGCAGDCPSFKHGYIVRVHPHAWPAQRARCAKAALFEAQQVNAESGSTAHANL